MRSDYSLEKSANIVVKSDYIQAKLVILPPDLDLSVHKLDLMENNLEIVLHEPEKEYKETLPVILEIQVGDSRQANRPETVHWHQIVQRAKIQVLRESYPIPFLETILIHKLVLLLLPMVSYLKKKDL